MARRTDVLRIKLEQSGDGKVKASLAGVEKSLDLTDKAADRAGKSFIGLKTQIAALGAAALAGGAIALRYADNIGKTADKLGFGVEALQEYRFAAKQAGIEQATFDLGLQRFLRRAAEAADGTGEAKQALKDLDVQLRDNNGSIRDGEALFADMADAISRVENPTQKLALAMKLFDSEGVIMLNLVRNGSKGIEDMRQKLRDLGGVLDEEVVRSAERSNAEFDLMSTILKAQLTDAAVSLAPIILDLSKRFGEMVGDTEKLSEKMTFLSNTFKVFSTLGSIVSSVMQAAGRNIGAVAAALVQLAQGNFSTAFTIIKQRAVDTFGDIHAAVNDVRDIWKDTAEDINNSAPELGRKIAAPLIIANKEVSAERKKLEGQINSIVKSLEFEAATLGKTAEQIALYKLELLGAGDADIRRAEAAAATIAQDRERADVMERVKAVIEETLTPQEKFIQQIQALNDIREFLPEGTYLAAVKKYQDELDNAIDKTDEFAEFSKEAARNIQDSFAEFLFDPFDKGLDGMFESFERTLRKIAAEAAASQILKSIGIFDAKGNPGSLFDSLAGAVGLGGGGGGSSSALNSVSIDDFFSSGFPGFANGGSFDVGGSGGTDSQLVAFRASPNERVTIETPAQQRGRGDVKITNNIKFIVQSNADGSINRQSLSQAAVELGRVSARSLRRNT